MRFFAWAEANLGAYFHGERHLAWSLVYLLRSFHCCGGCTCWGGHINNGEVLQLSDSGGISFIGRTHTNAWLLWRGFPFKAHSLHLQQIWWIWEHLWGAHLPRAHLVHLDLYFILDQVAIVSGSSIFCTCCIPPSSFLIYRHILQTSFPRGVLSRVMLTKNTCVQFHVC